ncbi:uncharacterized protein LOC120350245 isoform X1 [Nilaparvata lugens]|uniref:uncharacterized protein LOC120350245 isoform X1 n=1 Tax=Nilaparvata lugens TaxID=108931 RepID=UPI00193E7C9A|nr:uncharacterized protein LOC120350245 isoform X1 [Nilaparvata lugens]
MWTVLMGGWHQAFYMVTLRVPVGYQAPSCSIQPCLDMRCCSVLVVSTSLAGRGNHTNNNKKPNPTEVASPSNPSGSAPSGQVLQSEIGASGTQEVPLHSYVEATNIEKVSADHDMDDVSSITPSQLEREGEHLRKARIRRNS